MFKCRFCTAHRPPVNMDLPLSSEGSLGLQKSHFTPGIINPWKSMAWPQEDDHFPKELVHGGAIHFHDDFGESSEPPIDRQVNSWFTHNHQGGCPVHDPMLCPCPRPSTQPPQLAQASIEDFISKSNFTSTSSGAGRKGSEHVASRNPRFTCRNE